MTWKITDPQGNEAKKIIWETVAYTRGRGLDVGCGNDKIWPHAIGVDSLIDTALFGYEIKADVVLNGHNMPLFADRSMDWVFSSHMLEHCEDYVTVLKEMWRVIKNDGYLLLYLPDEDEYPKVGEEGCNPDHKWNVNYDKVVEAMKQVGAWDLVEYQKRNADKEYSLYFVFQKKPALKVLSHKFSCHDQKPEKTCAIVRYGAWGDGIQSTSILPALKEQGYHVTFYTTPRCHEVLQHEPLIDKFVVQDPEQVPNSWLGPFWEYLSKKYDKFVNLSESVEATMLAMPERIEYKWTQEARHMHMNQNYWAFMHAIAGVPYEKPLSRFYATESEKKWALAEKEKHGGKPTILWVLAGSSVHKVYEGIDQVLARLLLAFRDVKVITAGDDRCRQMIEAPWENEPKIVRRSGVWTIRQTMAFAQVCDLVIGPETGVMSAVAMDEMPKIVLLSHSSVENLTRDWLNTYSLFSTKTVCAPCHKLIFNFDQCNKDERTGTAACMAAISPDAVWMSILHAFQIEPLPITEKPMAAVIPIKEIEAA